MDDFPTYRQDLIVGVSLRVTAPLGQYDSTKLLNVGTNRSSFKPEIGVSKAWGSLILELIPAITFFTTNNDFLGGNSLAQAPIYSVEGHLIYGILASNRKRAMLPLPFVTMGPWLDDGGTPLSSLGSAGPALTYPAARARVTHGSAADCPSGGRRHRSWSCPGRSSRAPPPGARCRTFRSAFSAWRGGPPVAGTCTGTRTPPPGACDRPGSATARHWPWRPRPCRNPARRDPGALPRQ